MSNSTHETDAVEATSWDTGQAESTTYLYLSHTTQVEAKVHARRRAAVRDAASGRLLREHAHRGVHL